MEYKDTLNLPRTDFPMKADLVAREPLRVRAWEETGLYEEIQRTRADAVPFILHDGPPFANGDVHIGNGLNKILKDIVVRYKSLRGFRAPFIPGWDCHGLPIEFKVSQELRKAGAGPGAGDPLADPVVIRKACEAYARKYIDIQRGQFKRLGVLGDWGRPYLTLDKEYEADELRLFADVVGKGFVYRGKKPVYWSIPCRTALAEAEVEYRDHVSQSIFVKLEVVGRPGTSLVIWTTTPWTLPANLAVAYNSAFSYSQVRAGGETFIVATLRLPEVASKCGWAGYEIVRSLDAGLLAGIEYQHPFCARTGRLLAGDAFVEATTGTGFVHIAPGHGQEDYQLGLQHGLPIYSPVDDNGCLAYTEDLPRDRQMPAEMIGRSILEKHGKSDANEAVLHALRLHHALVHQENYHHSYPHCWRSKTPVIFRAMDQWFVNIDHTIQSPGGPGAEEGGSGRTFRAEALAAIDAVAWIPDWGINRIKGAVGSRPDWCISRQRTWGVPIPAFYDGEGRPILDARIVRNAADLIEKHGSNIWFERPAAELWPLLRPVDWTGPEAVSRSADTLDVWIDSGSSSRAVLMRRPELQRLPERDTASDSRGAVAGDPWRADLYLEGSDQHRGWFQSSLLLSLAGNGVPPYRTVLTHGFMVDADRQKISKSKQGQGTYEKPQSADAYVRKWGADVIRLWVASQDFRNDIIVSEERIGKVGETYRVIRNALRYQISNLYDFDPARDAVAEERLTPLDRWILSRLAQLEADVARAYDACEFHVVYQRISQFAAVDLSALYHDVVKDRLYTDPANSLRRRSTQTALNRLLAGLSRMLSPILVFTCDEVWDHLPARPQRSVHLSQWHPTPDGRAEGVIRNWEKLLEIREAVLQGLEEARQARRIGKALEACATLAWREAAPPLSGEDLTVLKELSNVSQLMQRTVTAEEFDRMPARGGREGLRVEIRHADGLKCERCWHWETDVGSVAHHPTLCRRCVDAVEGASPPAKRGPG